VNIFRHTLKKFLTSNTFYSIDEYISSKILLDKWMYCFCNYWRCAYAKLWLIISPIIFGSSNGVQMSFVILNLSVIVVDSIVSLQSNSFMTSSISGPDRTTDQWNYELCMHVCMYCKHKYFQTVYSSLFNLKMLQTLPLSAAHNSVIYWHYF
jgi:hypothetical protein